jgi:hypothetical protein
MARWFAWLVIIVQHLAITASELPEGCPNALDMRCWQLRIMQHPSAEVVARLTFLEQPGAWFLPSRGHIWS